MRINNHNLTGVVGTNGSESVQSSETSRHSASHASHNAGYDTVSLSNASSLISLSKTMHSADRQSRVAQLTTQVQSGNYQPDAQAIGRALIKNPW